MDDFGFFTKATPVITDTSTRAELEAAIVALRAKQSRLPVHYVDRRKEIADEIDALVERILGL